MPSLAISDLYEIYRTSRKVETLKSNKFMRACIVIYWFLRSNMKYQEVCEGEGKVADASVILYFGFYGGLKEFRVL